MSYSKILAGTNINRFLLSQRSSSEIPGAAAASMIICMEFHIRVV
jgi:hypothetical protein